MHSVSYIGKCEVDLAQRCSRIILKRLYVIAKKTIKYIDYDKNLTQKFRRRVSMLLFSQPNLFKLFDEVAHQALNKLKYWFVLPVSNNYFTNIFGDAFV